MSIHADTLAWPFFADSHRELAQAAATWAATHLDDGARPSADVDAACRALVKQLGAAGWLRHCIPASDGADTNAGANAALATLDTRAICLLRETFAMHSTLADFAFAMQGLGAGPISLFGSAAQRARYLPRVASGEAIAAFALSERDAGSDVAALACRATRLEDGSWRLDGEKTWISNGGIADFYVVFARSGEPVERSSDGISAFIVDAASAGLEVAERITTLSPHPLARLRFADCRVSADQLIGQHGEGFRIAMATLDLFRTSVAAAALGFARRACDAALHHVQARRMFGRKLADMQMTQAKIAEMVTAIDAAALLVYRAAWQRDQGRATTREAAMAKLFATEQAQFVVDAAVQMFGGRGVTQGEIVEALYRDIRALRIYEGASEVQKLVIARQTLGAIRE